MNQQEYDKCRELSWRRRLTPSEEAELQQFLTANPAGQNELQSEAELNQLLEKLPAAPLVASNFTARVLQAVELENAARNCKQAASPFWRSLHRWLPRTAVAALVAGCLVGGYHHRQANDRAVLAHNVAGMAEAVSADPDLMKDFESIRQLSVARPTADTELIALMK